MFSYEDLKGCLVVGGDINLWNLEGLVSTLSQKFREHLYQLKTLNTGSMLIEVISKHMNSHALQASPETIARPEN